MIIDNLTSLPSTITTGDELPVERGTTTYKIDYDALAAAILARLGAGSDNIVDVANGGTGANNALSARYNLESAHAGYLDNTVNVDNIRDSGLYYCAGCSATGIDDNVRLWGQLLVISSVPWNNGGTPGQYDRLCQVFFFSFQNNGQKWIQYRIYDSAWSGWRVLLDNYGAVPVVHGGTGAMTAAAARTNLGITPANIGAALVSYNYSGNIDNLFDTGMYYMIGATGTGGIQDDGKLFGMLLVVKNGSSSRAVQLHVGLFTLGVEFRVYIDSWSAWKTLALTT